MKFLLLVFSLIFCGFAYSSTLVESIFQAEVLEKFSLDKVILNYTEGDFYKGGHPDLYYKAENGDEDAQLILGGVFYRMGALDKALYWFEEAAEGYNAEAATILGIMHYTENWFVNADLVSVDYDKAYGWFEEAVKEDDNVEVAQFYLATMNALGHEVSEDLEEAIEILEDVSDYDDTADILIAASLYSDDEEEEAIEMFEDLSDDGNKTAKFALALIEFQEQ